MDQINTNSESSNLIDLKKDGPFHTSNRSRLGFLDDFSEAMFDRILYSKWGQIVWNKPRQVHNDRFLQGARCRLNHCWNLNQC